MPRITNIHAVTPEVQGRALAQVNKFLASRIAPRVLAAAEWTNKPLKELSESLTITYMAMQLRPRADPTIDCLVVGDGTSPRTAHLVVNLTAWNVHSVDPAMKPKYTGFSETSPRVTAFRCGVKELPYHLQYDVVLAPHSHASAKRTRARCLPGGVVVAMPCCVSWEDTPGQVYVADCLSPARVLVVEGLAR